MFTQLYEYRELLIARLEAQPGEFTALAAALPEAEWYLRRAPDGATLHQLAAHVRDAEALAYWPRIRRILTEDSPHLDPFPHHRWSVEAHYHADEPVISIAASFTLVREEHMAPLKALPPEAWARSGFHPPSGPRTLQWWVERLCTHAQGHLVELQRLAGSTEPQPWSSWLP